MTDDASLPLPKDPQALPPRRRRGRPRKDARPVDQPNARSAVLNSAAYLFASRGYENASLSDVAAGAGVTTGAIYAHFRGKAELLVEVVRETLAFLSFRSSSSRPDRSPSALAGYARWLVQPEQRTTRRLIDEVFTAASRDPEVQAMVSEYALTETAAVADMIRTWQDAGECDATIDPLLTAQQFFAEILGLCRIDTLAPELVEDRRWVELVVWRVHLLLNVPVGHRGVRRFRPQSPRSASGRATRSK